MEEMGGGGGVEGVGGKEGERLNPFNIRKWVVGC